MPERMGRMGKKKRDRKSRQRGYDSSYSDSSSSDGISTEETPPTRSSDIHAMIEEVISKEAKGIKRILKVLKEELKELKEEMNERHNQLKEGINEIHNQLKKRIENHIVPLTQLEQLNGSSGDGSPAPRSEPNQMQPPTFSLKFESEVGNSVEKGKSITIKVKMYDGGNPIGEKLKDGRPHPLASAKVMLVVLDGKFNDNRSSWSKADFKESIKTSTAGDVNQGIVSNCVFYLHGGTGHHSGATITENSGNKKVKLGVMVLPDDSYGEYKNVRVLEGVSKESFLVRDPRRPSKKQKEMDELFRGPSAVSGQLQLQEYTNMPSGSSTLTDNTLGANPRHWVAPSTNQQPSSSSERHRHIPAGVQMPMRSDLDVGVQQWISELANQPMHGPYGGRTGCTVFQRWHRAINAIIFIWRLQSETYYWRRKMRRPMLSRDTGDANLELLKEKQCMQDSLLDAWTSEGFRVQLPKAAVMKNVTLLDPRNKGGRTGCTVVQRWHRAINAIIFIWRLQSETYRTRSMRRPLLSMWHRAINALIFISRLQSGTYRTGKMRRPLLSRDTGDACLELLKEQQCMQDSLLDASTSGVEAFGVQLPKAAVMKNVTLLDPRNKAGQAQTMDERMDPIYELRFHGNLKARIYTKKPLLEQSDERIEIAIYRNGQIITSGHLSSVRVEIVALESNHSCKGSWTEEDFHRQIQLRRGGQGSVLEGDRYVKLVNGKASLGNVRFSEGSSGLHSRQFVLAARIDMSEKFEGLRVKEAFMQPPITVLVARSEVNEKSVVPMLNDKVHRLKEIAKVYSQRLEQDGICTVQDFLKALNKDENKLRQILKMKSDKSWKVLVGHARECNRRDEHELKPYMVAGENVTLFFNCIHDNVGAEFNGRYIAKDKFDPVQKALVDRLKKQAYNELESIDFQYVMKDNKPQKISANVNAAGSSSIPMPGASPRNTSDHHAHAVSKGMHSLPHVHQTGQQGISGKGNGMGARAPQDAPTQRRRSRLLYLPDIRTRATGKEGDHKKSSGGEDAAISERARLGA